MANVQLLKGDCIELMRAMPENSVDSIVTDPPYGLEFMGNDWDAPWKGKPSSKGFVEIKDGRFGGFKQLPDHTRVSNVRCAECQRWKLSSNPCVCDEPKFPNARLDAMNVFQQWFTEVAAEALRVLKPGGHLLAFGGTRTYHRMACAIEDAGFEIRDSIHWVYGSGFPKSLNISKAIDKAAGVEREVVGKKLSGIANSKEGTRHTIGASKAVEVDVTISATEEAKQWDGWGTALKPAHEPIVVARKPISKKTVAANVLEWGTGGLNIDGTRVGSEERFNPSSGSNSNNTVAFPVGDETEGRPATGRWPANFVITHSYSCVRVGEAEDNYAINSTDGWSGFGDKERPDYFGTQVTGTRSVWECVPGCPVANMDIQSGESGTGKRSVGKVKGTTFGSNNPMPDELTGVLSYGDKGGASRFFTQADWEPHDFPFMYQAKPSKKERNAGLDGLPEEYSARTNGFSDKLSNTKVPRANTHPTVKPVALMRHLVRLVTPPGGTVLDPFAGSGTTLVASVLEGFNAVGCEMTEEYFPIIEGRVAWAEKEAAGMNEKPVQKRKKDKDVADKGSLGQTVMPI
jgi:site-specific DNA-methyltransferase (adenine-specific)